MDCLRLNLILSKRPVEIVNLKKFLNVNCSFHFVKFQKKKLNIYLYFVVEGFQLLDAELPELFCAVLEGKSCFAPIVSLCRDLEICPRHSRRFCLVGR